MRQGDAALAAPTATARIGADRTSVDVDLIYAVAGEADDLSARLNTFTAAPLTSVRTQVRYLPASGSPQIVDITGAPTRVTFDPPASTVAREFVRRALTGVLAAGDHVLFLACLLVASRRAGTAARLVFVTAIAQTATSVLAGSAPSLVGSWLPIAATIAASAVVVGALQTIAGADARWVYPLAIVFGLLNGATFGETLATSRSFAGAHAWTATVTFVLAVAGGQLWIGGVMWATWRWLIRAGLPERVGAIVVSALVAHTALHRVGERTQALADGGTLTADRALIWLTVAWAGVMLAVAVVDTLRHPDVHDERVTGAARRS
jgi:hypothetical protein